jgi:hypothetical protein
MQNAKFKDLTPPKYYGGIYATNNIEYRNAGINTDDSAGQLLDSDVAKIYGVETRDINKAVTNNPDKFPAGYFVELSKPEKIELVENFHRFN